MSQLTPRLQEIIEDFSYCEGTEKLEYLLEFSEQLRPLPDHLQGKQDEMEAVHECITPIFVDADVHDNKMTFHFHAPPEAPTARGYASLLQQGLEGATPEQVLAIPNEFYLDMGIQHVLTGQRLNGVTAILNYMKRLATQSLGA